MGRLGGLRAALNRPDELALRQEVPADHPEPPGGRQQILSGLVSERPRLT